MKCVSCGREIDNDSLFCEHCGAKQTQEEIDQHTAEEKELHVKNGQSGEPLISYDEDKAEQTDRIQPVFNRNDENHIQENRNIWKYGVFALGGLLLLVCVFLFATIIRNQNLQSMLNTASGDGGERAESDAPDEESSLKTADIVKAETMWAPGHGTIVRVKNLTKMYLMPDVYAEHIDRLMPDEEFQVILDEGDNWIKIAKNGEYGYVIKDDVEVSGTILLFETEAKEDVTIYNEDGSGREIISLKKGDTVYVFREIEDEDGVVWYRIEVPGSAETASVRADVLDPSLRKETKHVAAADRFWEPGDCALVMPNSKDYRIHVSAFEESETIQINPVNKNGEFLVYAFSSDGWICICDPETQNYGLVREEDFSETGSMAKGMARITEGAAAYSGKGTNYDRICTFDADDIWFYVDFYSEQEGGWYLVETASGYGYVPEEFVDISAVAAMYVSRGVNDRIQAANVQLSETFIQTNEDSTLLSYNREAEGVFSRLCVGVSESSGEVDWPMLSASPEVTFAMIHIGSVESIDAKEVTPKTDRKMYENTRRANRYYMGYGLFLDVTAKTTEDAKQCADYYLKQANAIKRRHPAFNMPIAVQFQPVDGISPKDLYMDVMLPFFTTILNKSGYIPMLYISDAFLTEMKAATGETFDSWPVWINLPDGSTKPENACSFWYYKSKVKLSGVEGSYAMNLCVKLFWGTGEERITYNDKGQRIITVTARDVNVREKADAASEVIGRVNKGDTFELDDLKVDAYGTEWYQITYNGKTGFIRSDLAE